MANVRSKKVNGNLVWWDTHANRWLDAIGPGVVKLIETWVGAHLPAADNPAGWTVTLVEAGIGETTIAPEDGVPGILLLTTDANEDDGATLQIAKEAFKLVAGNPCYFGVTLKVSEATQSDLLVGLCITNTNPLGGLTDGIYFRKVDGSTDVKVVSEKNSTETESVSVHTLADNVYVTLELFYDGVDVHPYVNGVAKPALAITNLPDDEELTPTVQFLSGAAGVQTMRLKPLRAIQVNA